MKKKIAIFLSIVTILASFSSIAFANGYDDGHIPPLPIRDSVIVEK